MGELPYWFVYSVIGEKKPQLSGSTPPCFRPADDKDLSRSGENLNVLLTTRAKSLRTFVSEFTSSTFRN